jgi:hypothetical protein
LRRPRLYRSCSAEEEDEEEEEEEDEGWMEGGENFITRNFTFDILFFNIVK